eukprot:scaffold86469_cov51-Phaeocystis_antarctica.AAC.4
MRATVREGARARMGMTRAARARARARASARARLADLLCLEVVLHVHAAISDISAAELRGELLHNRSVGVARHLARELRGRLWPSEYTRGEGGCGHGREAATIAEGGCNHSGGGCNHICERAVTTAEAAWTSSEGYTLVTMAILP